jgi:hypothetical protein
MLIDEDFSHWTSQANTLLTEKYAIDIQDAGLDDVYLARHYHQGCSPVDFVDWFAKKHDLIPLDSFWINGLVERS